MSLGHADGMSSRIPARASVIVPVQIARIADTFFDVLSRNFTTAGEGSCNGCGPGRRRISSDGDSDIDIFQKVMESAAIS
jgi:hypothetical protein